MLTLHSIRLRNYPMGNEWDNPPSRVVGGGLCCDVLTGKTETLKRRRYYEAGHKDKETPRSAQLSSTPTETRTAAAAAVCLSLLLALESLYNVNMRL